MDIVAIVISASVDAGSQLTALRSEAERRSITLPVRFSVPDRGLWERGYAAEAGRSLLPVARTLDDALATVTPFSTRCSMEAPPAGGTPSTVGGRRNGLFGGEVTSLRLGDAVAALMIDPVRHWRDMTTQTSDTIGEV